ncbi:hypothetical protein HKX48_008630 [Thoreauomyces humboldtii]|nr:hypothetical protein HKX48_008630 [Thoreauomyces humboldtii]
MEALDLDITRRVRVHAHVSVLDGVHQDLFVLDARAGEKTPASVCFCPPRIVDEGLATKLPSHDVLPFATSVHTPEDKQRASHLSEVVSRLKSSLSVRVAGSDFGFTIGDHVSDVLRVTTNDQVIVLVRSFEARGIGEGSDSLSKTGRTLLLHEQCLVTYYATWGMVPSACLTYGGSTVWAYRLYWERDTKTGRKCWNFDRVHSQVVGDAFAKAGEGWDEKYE